MTRTFYTGKKPGVGLKGAHLWFMHYSSETETTSFSRWGEKRRLPRYVSHRRFAQLLPFL